MYFHFSSTLHLHLTVTHEFRSCFVSWYDKKNDQNLALHVLLPLWFVCIAEALWEICSKWKSITFYPPERLNIGQFTFNITLSGEYSLDIEKAISQMVIHFVFMAYIKNFEDQEKKKKKRKNKMWNDNTILKEKKIGKSVVETEIFKVGKGCFFASFDWIIGSCCKARSKNLFLNMFYILYKAIPL